MLIEVIVVSVIVAVLAAAAIPLYNEYIRAQKRSAAKALAQSGAVTANIFYRRTGGNPDSSQLNLFLSDSARYDVRVHGRFIVVTDTSSHADPQKDSAAFR